MRQKPLKYHRDQTHWSSTATDTYPTKTASPLILLAGTPQGESRVCRSLFCTGSLKETLYNSAGSDILSLSSCSICLTPFYLGHFSLGFWQILLSAHSHDWSDFETVS